MKVPPGVFQVGLAMKKKYAQDASVDDVLAAEAKQAQHRKPPATEGKARRAKSLERSVEDNPCHQPEPVIIVPEQEQEQPTIIIKPAYPGTHGLEDTRPFGATPPMEVTRVELVKFALAIIETEGPHSTNQLLERAFKTLSDDEWRVMKQRLPKWLIAECRDRQPPLTMRRWRGPEGAETRHRLLGFWPPDVEKTRTDFERGELLRAIAKLQEDIAIIRQVQSEVLQRQDKLRAGIAAMLEKLTWNGEL